MPNEYYSTANDTFEWLKISLPENPDREERIAEIIADKEHKLSVLEKELTTAVDALEMAVVNCNFPREKEPETLAEGVEQFFHVNKVELGYGLRDKIRVDPITFAVEIRAPLSREGEWNEAHDKKVSTAGVEMLRYLALNGIDVADVPFQDFEAFFNANKAYLQMVTAGESFLTTVELDCFNQIETLYEKDLETYITGLCENLSIFADSETYTQNLATFTQFITSLRENRFWNVSFHPQATALRTVIQQEFTKLMEKRATLPASAQQNLLDTLDEHQEDIFKTFGRDLFEKSMRNNPEKDYETIMASMFNLTETEKTTKRDRNWKEVNNYIRQLAAERRTLTSEDLEKMHQISSRGILPPFIYGVRRPGHIGEAGADEVILASPKGGSEISGVPAENVEGEMQNLLIRANSLTKNVFLPKALFEIELGNLFAEYVRIHPHYDGNGTMAVFFVETLKTMRGGYELKDDYLTPQERGSKSRLAATVVKNEYYLRVLNALEWSPPAIAVAYRARLKEERKAVSKP